LGRVGADFMDLARPGDIKTHCNPNALSSFLEYLIDYASPETKEIGLKCIKEQVEALNDEAARHVNKLLDQVKSGKRDVFC
jgi:2-iminoacetate synthase